MGDKGIESSLAKKDFRLLVSEMLDLSQHCAFATQKAKYILNCLKSIIASRVREAIMSLYSTLVGPHLERILLWDPQHRKT